MGMHKKCSNACTHNKLFTIKLTRKQKQLHNAQYVYKEYTFETTIGNVLISLDQIHDYTFRIWMYKHDIYLYRGLLKIYQLHNQACYPYADKY